MSPRIPLLDQCAKAVADVPHAADCNAIIIGDARFCTCREVRDGLIAVGLRAAIRTAKRVRFNPGDLEDAALDAFRRAAAAAPSGGQEET